MFGRQEMFTEISSCVLDLEGGDRTDQTADAFPPEGVTYAKYYLDGRSRTLTTEPATESATADYDCEFTTALASFVIRFGDETVIVGYPKARLWVEAAPTTWIC